MSNKVVTVTLKTDTKQTDKKLDKVNKSLKKTEKQAKETGSVMTSAFNALPASVQGLIGQVKNLGTSFKAIAVGGVVGAIAGLGTLFVTATKKGAEFAKQMSTLEAVSGASAIEMEKMAESAKQLGASTQFTAKQVGELQTEFAKMGFSTDQILASTEATLALAASMEVGLAEAATLAGSTVNAFGLEAEDTQRVVDVLAKSTSTSALDFSSLTESLKNVAPSAKATNVTVEKTTALLAVLADNGIKGSRAGTGLTAAFVELNKKGLTLEEALKQIGESSNQLGTAMDIAGKQGGKALLTLTGQEDKIDRLTLSLENSAGAAQEMAEVRLDNLAGDTTKLSSAWEGFLLSIEDGEGMFNSIARGIVQATTALLNFITPTTKLSEQLEKERIELFKTEAELDRLDEKMRDTTLSEEELKLVQDERITIIRDLKKEYPDLLKDIKAEEVSTQDLKKAIDEVNKSLINKILIQEKEEEIMEQAEESAEELNDLLEKEAETRDFVAKLQAEYTKLGLEFQETDPVKFQEELNDVIEREQQLLREGNGEGKLKIDQLSKLQKRQNDLFFKIKAVNKAEENYQEEVEKGNVLLNEKDAILKRLGITQDEEIEKTEESNDATIEEIEVTNSLIKIQEDLLEQAQQMPESTEAELRAKNRKIDAINKEIKRLKSLGVEQKNEKKDTTDLIALKQQELKEIQNTEAATKKEVAQRNDRIKAIQKEIQELQNLTDKKLAIEKIDFDEIGRLETRKAKTIEVNKTADDQVARYSRKVEDKTVDYIRMTEEEKRALREKNALFTANALAEASSIISGFAELNQEKFDTLNENVIQEQERLSQQILNNESLTNEQKRIEIARMNAVKEKELDANNKRAERAFKVQKGANIATALATTYLTAVQAYQSQFMPIPDPSSPIRGSIAAGLAVGAGLMNVAQIRRQKFEAASFAPVELPQPNLSAGAGGGADGGASQTQAPSFNVVGQSGFNQIAGALGSAGPIQAFVVSGDVTTAQQLQNNTITQATF